MLTKARTILRDNSDRIKRLSREGAWIVLGQSASVLGTLAMVRVLTEQLSPVQYGELALGFTLAVLVNQVVMGGIINGISRYYSIAAEKNDLRGYLKAVSKLMSYATLAVVVLAILIFTGLLLFGKSQWMELAAAVLLFSVLSGFNSAFSGIQNAARQRAIVALHMGLDSWLKIGMALGMLLWFEMSSTAVVLGYCVSAFFVTCSQLFFLQRVIRNQRRREGAQADEKWCSKMWAFGWPFSTWGLFTWLQQASDRWALQLFATTKEVGQYAVVFQLGYTPIILVTGLLMSLFAPILYQRSGDATDQMRNASVHRIVWSITQVSLSLTTIGFTISLFLHGWLFEWLVAEAFREASYYLPWIILAGGFFATGQVLSLKLMSEIRSRSLLYVKIVTAFLGVLANGLGTWYFGVNGTVAALVFFSMVFMLWMIYLAMHLPSKQFSLS